MTTPKAIVFKASTSKSVSGSPLDRLFLNEDIDEILDFKAKFAGYTMVNSLEAALTFLGDEQDYLNCMMDNNDAVRQRYGFEEKIISFTCSDQYYNNVFKGATIFGHVKKSDKINLMPYGIYSFTNFEGFYPGFTPLKVNTDDYIQFENSDVMNLQKTVLDFFKNRSIYEENKVRHKGASLVFGSPGNGKSSLIMNLINRPDFEKVYVIFIPKHMSFKSLEGFKESFNGHDTLIIMEEMTERMGNGTEDILNFLDGYSSWNNCYVLATTNYPEVLPPNLIDRPGRFNNLVEIKPPTDDQKVFFLKQKGFSDEDIAKILVKAKDFSLDYIAQLALTAKIQKLPLIESLTILENNKKKVKGSFKGKSSLGL